MKYWCILLLFFSLSTKAGEFDYYNDSSIYPQQQVTLSTGTGNLIGSLMRPINDETKAIVLIIAGSGPTDRDGNNTFMKNDCLLQLAEGLAANGIASVRYDKRGIAASAAAMTKEEDLRFDTYIDDAKEWLLWIRKELYYRTIIVAGHSEGSLIGMIAAKGLADKYISLAGAGEPIGNTLKRQLQKQVPNMMNRCNSIIDSLNQGIPISNPPKVLMSLFRPSVQPYLISWLKYNPQQEIKKLRMPVMIVQGNKDLQVNVDDARMLQDAKPNAAFILVEDMNHVFKTVTNDQDNYKSYGEPMRPISAELVTAISSFIRQ